ncbi:MAG: SDR family oxidoreductase [bacterium]|nr:SDR family oxidoreductase [bacterium]
MTESLHIWITGAGTGIGASIAHALAGAHRVSLLGRNKESLDAVASVLPAKSWCVTVADVSDATAVSSAYVEAVKQQGPVDVLINNAGVGFFKPLVDMTFEEFDEQIDVNLRGAFLCAKSVLPSMLERRSGMIINVNSVASITAFEGGSAYGASKSGLLTMMRTLRNEVRTSGVKITDILLGATQTRMWSEESLNTHHKRMMQADDVADCIRTLVDGFYNPRTHIEEIILRPQHGDL